jgi:hypothetical protein
VLNHDFVTAENCNGRGYDAGITAQHADLGDSGGIGGDASQHQYARLSACGSFHLSAATTYLHTAEPLRTAISSGD